MNTVSFAVRDSITMLGRTLRHTVRNPPAILGALVTPIFLLLMMVYVFGGAVRIEDATGAATSYINYIVPGMLMITIIQGTGMVAVRINADMQQGIIARFRTMSISRAAVLNGHVGGTVIGIVISIGAVIGLALLIGFRPTANLVEWGAALGLLTLFAIAVTLLAAALGLVIKTPDGVNSSLLPCICFRTSAAHSRRPTRCLLRWHGSPDISRSRPSSKRYAGCSWAPRSATVLFSPSHGASALSWSASCGHGQRITASPYGDAGSAR